MPDVPIEWAPNPPEDEVTEYQLSVDGGAPQSAPATATSLTVSVPASGTHNFSLVAVNADGSSDPDIHDVRVGPPGKPRTVRIGRATF